MRTIKIDMNVEELIWNAVKQIVLEDAGPLLRGKYKVSYDDIFVNVKLKDDGQIKSMRVTGEIQYEEVVE